MANTKKGSNSGVLDMTAALVQPAENENKTPDTVPYAQYEELRESYRKKCEELDNFTKAYYGLQQKSAEDIEKVRRFIEVLNIGFNVIWPKK